MEVIKRTRTIEEVTGYEAEDGTIFKTKEECEKYEDTAKVAVYKAFKELMVNGEEFAECEIWENFGYGSEEFDLAVIDIKSETDLEIANRYYELNGGYSISKDFMGKKVLVNIGFCYDNRKDCPPNPRTKEMLIEEFTKDITKFFEPEVKENK